MYLDWSKQDRDYIAIDVEADSLDPTIIWCLCWENVKTKEKGVITNYDEIREFFRRNYGAIFVGHNLLKFDAPVLNRLVGTRLGVSRLVDTLVLSTLYSPSLDGGHSLGAWGERIGIGKGDFSDWSKLSSEMVEYCQQDVKLTAELYRRLANVLNRIGFSELSCKIQHEITVIAERQRKNGFEFDAERAIIFYQQLRRKASDLEEQIQSVFPAERVFKRESRTRVKNGDYSSQYTKDVASNSFEIEVRGETYLVYERVPFNIGSPKQRVDRLLALGWEPREFTKKGHPQPFDKGDLSESLKEFLEENSVPEVLLIAKWMSVSGRANMVNNWLDNWNEETGRIHGKLFVADTLRFRHQAPNTANIPAVRVKEYKNEHGVVARKEVLRGDDGYWTYEARDLWRARPGRVLVGTDAAGLELRMLAHFLNRPAFTEQVLDGDPHQYNADLAGVSRPRAKTLLYAIQYGAQAGKVASIIKGTKKEGAALRDLFLERLGIKELMNDAISEQRSGRVRLVDGSMVICPSEHSALNYKLQGSGARVMALASILLERSIRVHGLDSLKVGDIHDEWQYDVAASDADEHARLSVEAIREAGRQLGLTIPLDGTAKKGLTWAETH